MVVLRFHAMPGYWDEHKSNAQAHLGANQTPDTK